MCFEARREERREIEGREDSQAVADGEEGEGGEWDGARRTGGAEELGEFVVFVEAERKVGGAGCDKFGGAGCGGGGGCAVDGGGRGVDCVGGEVGAEVEALEGSVSIIKLEGRCGRGPTYED